MRLVFKYVGVELYHRWDECPTVSVVILWAYEGLIYTPIVSVTMGN